MTNLVLHSLSSSNPLRKELIQGEEYRSFKKNEDVPIQPVRSPVDISFFVHRKRYVRKVEENIKLTKSSPNEASTSNSKHREVKSKSVPLIKHSFWERAKLSHKQYTDVLSTPHLHGSGDSAGVKSLHSQTAPNICSPRLAQMAHPNKRRILGVWQEHGNKLPVDALQRLHDMLYTNQSIDMKEARNFFKICDNKKRKQERKLKLKRKKKRNQKEATWLKEQLEETSSAILNHFSKEPNLDTSFKQLLLSDVLLSVLGKFTKKKEPILRYSPNLYDKALVKVVDKIAIWIDNVSKIVEIQGLEEEEEAEAQKEISKISEELSSVISSVTLSENEPDQIEEAESGTKEEVRITEIQESKGEDVEDEALEGLEKVSSLQRLIQILASASSGYLSDTVDYEDLTRNELLHRMKILNKDYVKERPAEIMKKILMDWAIHSAPDKVDPEIVDKIDKMAEIIVAMLEAEEVYGMMGIKPEEAIDQKVSIEDNKDAIAGSLPGTIKSGEKADAVAGSKPGSKVPSDKKASDLIKVTDFEEDVKPEPGTLTEVEAPDGTVQMGVIDENGEVTPVQLTPSGNLIPTVYDKNGKVVKQVFDEEGNLLDSTLNKYGVPEPDNYSGALFDDEKKPHELIFNKNGKIIPQCYDKDGNPIAADYDSDGNPLFFGKDGKPISVKSGESVKIVNDEVIVMDKDGKPIAEDKETELDNKEVITEENPPKKSDSKEQNKPTEGADNTNTLEPLPEENETEVEKGTKEEKQEEGTNDDIKNEGEKLEDEKEGEKKKDEIIGETKKKDEMEGNEIQEEKKVDDIKVEEDKTSESSEMNKQEETLSEKEKKEKSIEDIKEAKEKLEEEKPEKSSTTQEEKDEIVIDDQSKEEKKEVEEAVEGKEVTEDQEQKKEDAEGQEEKKPEEEKQEGKDQEIKKEEEQSQKIEEQGVEQQEAEEQKAKEKEGETQLEEEQKEEKQEEEEQEEEVQGKELQQEEQEGKEQEKEEQVEEEQEEEEEEEEQEEEEQEASEKEESQAEIESTKPEDEAEIIPKEKEEVVSPSSSRESLITVIKGHKPRRIQEHSKDTVCCLSMKVWAVWLLEITHNAQNWTKWISNIISQIREFAAILRGEVLLPNGQKKVIYKEDWNKFVEDMNGQVIAWRQYSRHINDLTKNITDRFHGKKVHCCEKCLQDHLIKNVVAAHDTMRSLTEALNCTGYWQRCLDEIVQETSKLFTVKPPEDEPSTDGETGWSYSSSSEESEDYNYN